jgi:hypothetical protein
MVAEQVVNIAILTASLIVSRARFWPIVLQKAFGAASSNIVARKRNQCCFKHSHLSIQLLHIVIRDHLRIEFRNTTGYR